LAIYAENTGQPFVQVFTGKYAAREVYEDILKVTKKEYYYLSAPHLTYAMVDKNYMKEWVERRVKKGIRSHSLRVKSQEVVSEPIFNEEENYLRQIRYLPAYVDLKASIYIYENNIAVISTRKEEVAYIMYSPDLAFSMRAIFQFLWSVSMKS
jgi:HTH-type transcriptional regulator, sugar sensing transcriptional regulator